MSLSSRRPIDRATRARRTVTRLVGHDLGSGPQTISPARIDRDAKIRRLDDFRPSDRRQPKYASRETRPSGRSRPAEACRNLLSPRRRQRHRASSDAWRRVKLGDGFDPTQSVVLIASDETSDFAGHTSSDGLQTANRERQDAVRVNLASAAARASSSFVRQARASRSSPSATRWRCNALQPGKTIGCIQVSARSIQSGRPRPVKMSSLFRDIAHRSSVGRWAVAHLRLDRRCFAASMCIEFRSDTQTLD